MSLNAMKFFKQPDRPFAPFRGRPVDGPEEQPHETELLADLPGPKLDSTADQSNPQPELERQAIEERAFQKGWDEGLRQARAELWRVFETLEQTLVELNRLKNELPARAEKLAVKLALEIAKKIVRRELRSDYTAAFGSIKAALSLLPEGTAVTVKLNPEDYQGLTTSGMLENGEGSFKAVSLQPDSDIERGGCFISSDYGNIDARLDQQFREIERVLLEE